jgi:5-(aminomethyl)-3-furanmethanol phosphate kinase
VKPHAVVKLGGSLLDWPALPARLRAYLESRSGQRLLLIVGGGPAADFIRALDQRHRHGNDRAHALALHALDFTAHVACALCPGLVVVEDLAACAQVWLKGQTPVLAPRLFLEQDDRQDQTPNANPLPHSWDATSDSIAARLATRLGAGELVLLKSASLRPGTDRAEAARLGLVDPLFPEEASAIKRVIYINFRENEPSGVEI